MMLQALLHMARLNPYTTFAEFHRHCGGRRLTVHATRLRDGACVAFNHETSPDVFVVDAVLASSSVPFVFTPVDIGGVLYVDGALSIDVRAEIRKDEQSLAKLSATSSSLGAELAAQQRAVRRCVEEMAESHARAERASGAAARAVQLEAAAAAAELNSLRRERAESPAGGDDFGGDDFGGYDDELMEV